MEQAYRVLCKKLSEHPLVARVKFNYFDIRVTWKSGLRETWAIWRKERTDYSRFRNCRLLAPVVVPPVRWWDELSNDKQLVRTFSGGINEFEHDVSKYPAFTKWSWKEFTQLGFYEKKIFVHEFLQFILDNGWVDKKYNQDILKNSLQLVYNEPLRYFHNKKGWKLVKNYQSVEKPAYKLIDHFMPLARYAPIAHSHMFNKRSIYFKKILYRGITSMIRFNNKRVKAGEKPPYPNFDYDSLLANLHIRDKRTVLVKIRPINLYRNVIKEFGMCGKTMFDFEPRFGEKAIAAFVEECPYFYKPTCPFDMTADDLAKFLGTTFGEDKGGHYDFALVDFNFKFNMTIFNMVMETVYPRVDSLIIFVTNEYMAEVLARYKPIRSKLMRICKYEPWNGAFLLY